VLGVRDLDTIMTIGELPTLLQRASKDVVEMIGMLDQQVLMVLRAGWELPDEVWRCYRSFASRSRAHRIAE